MGGFEPPTSRFQGENADRAALHPEKTVPLKLSKTGAPGESRTPKISLLRRACLPVPSPGRHVRSLRLCPHATRTQGGQVSLHKGANPCTSSPGACALIERAVVQRHTRSEAVQRIAPHLVNKERPPTRPGSGRWSIPGAITWESTQSKTKKARCHLASGPCACSCLTAVAGDGRLRSHGVPQARRGLGLTIQRIQMAGLRCAQLLTEQGARQGIGQATVGCSHVAAFCLTSPAESRTLCIAPSVSHAATRSVRLRHEGGKSVAGEHGDLVGEMDVRRLAKWGA